MPRRVEYHIARLKDKNPRVRADSARELGLLGDPAALEALEALFRIEDDPQVKQAIQAAGRKLYMKKSERKASGAER